jgi:hypothetical protein
VYVQVGLKGMMLVNGISKLGRFFGLPLPTVLCTPPPYSKCCHYKSRMNIQSCLHGPDPGGVDGAGGGDGQRLGRWRERLRLHRRRREGCRHGATTAPR